MVKALVVRDGHPWSWRSAEFKKGAAPVVTDPRWQTETGNNPFAGPFDQQAHGLWREDSSGTIYNFLPTGEITEHDSKNPTPVGWWWYDFPDDPFEDENHTGKGEVLWTYSGEKQNLRLRTVDTKELEILFLTGKKLLRRLE